MARSCADNIPAGSGSKKGRPTDDSKMFSLNQDLMTAVSYIISFTGETLW